VYRAVVSEVDLVHATSAQAVDTVIARFGETALRHFATRLGDINPALRRELIELARHHQRDPGKSRR
jgi:predicted transcriptional regulator